MSKLKKSEAKKKSGLGSRIKNILKQYKRVLTVARKPGKDEFTSSMKITGSGVLFLGLLGFVIFLMYYLIQVAFGA